MASSLNYSLKLLFLIFIILDLNLAKTIERRSFKSIISFGDSIADTGNRLLTSPPNEPPDSAFPPYGQTFFGRPTGRSCNGRLVIDFIAENLGLPLVPPYFGGQNLTKKSFKGVNFAVGGATALDINFFMKQGLDLPLTNITLSVQIKLFKDLLPSLCSSPSECRKLVSQSLVLMGEIGGNDFNRAFLRKKKSIEEIRKFVPLVIHAISSAIEELIKLGAVTILVPGNFPLGCSAAYLTSFANSSDNIEYDIHTGCLNWLNDFSQYQNNMLRSELIRIQNLNPRANLIYIDYYNSALRLFKYPDLFGFIKRPIKACCGKGGTYNYDVANRCGNAEVSRCDDPSVYVNWDGIHFTEAAYALIAKDVIKTVHHFSSSSSLSTKVKTQECIPVK